MLRKRYFFVLVFAVFVLYSEKMQACEILNSSFLELEEIPISSLCESSMEALVGEDWIREAEEPYLDLVIEIMEVQSGKIEYYIQVWDGDYLRYTTMATEYYDDSREWVSISGGHL